MRELKTEFQKWGGEVKFRQVYKSSKAVVYQCNGRWYELFRYKVGKPNEFNTEEYEMYPSDRDFGSWAWNCHDKEKVEEVLRRVDEKGRKKCFPDITDEEIEVIMSSI